MTTERFNREGEPMRPLGYIGDGPDFEVYRVGSGYAWEAYSRDRLLKTGRARNRIGLTLGLWRARRRLRREIERTAR